MTTVKCYDCICGEEIYEDDDACVNCGNIVDQSKFIEEPLYEIVSQGKINIIEIPLIKTPS